METVGEIICCLDSQILEIYLDDMVHTIARVNDARLVFSNVQHLDFVTLRLSIPILMAFTD